MCNSHQSTVPAGIYAGKMQKSGEILGGKQERA